MRFRCFIINVFVHSDNKSTNCHTLNDKQFVPLLPIRAFETRFNTNIFATSSFSDDTNRKDRKKDIANDGIQKACRKAVASKTFKYGKCRNKDDYDRNHQISNMWIAQKNLK